MTGVALETWAENPPRGFRHDALMYGSDAEFVAAAAPFVEAGHAQGEPVAVVTTPDNSRLLQSALGAGAADVDFRVAGDWYDRPARTIARYHALLESKLDAGATSVRVIGEVAFGRSKGEYREWTQYEAALNRAFEGRPAWVVCPYDTRRLPPAVVADAARTHPHVADADGRRRSDRFHDPRALVRALGAPYPEAFGPPPLDVTVTREALRVARRLFEALLGSAAVPEQRARELVVGLQEILTNAVLHGGEPARLRCWVDGGVISCEVSDPGCGIDDPLVGLIPPRGQSPGGRGLWIARQLFDGVEFHRLLDGGFVVRLTASVSDARDSSH
jgi:anti-sigma regulatory factor (Ser/Thr protein kinase)